METKYQKLWRPKRKLCYLTNKESQSKEWAEKLSLGNIDRMFDGLDSPLKGVDISLPSPLHTSDTESNQSEREISVPQEGQPTIKLQGPRRAVLQSARRSLAPELDIVEGLNIPFKLHGPAKTSSPIEEKIVVEAVGGEDSERALVVPRILNFEQPKSDLLSIQIPQGNMCVTEETVDSDLESPPSKVTLSKPTMSSHKKQVTKSRKEIPFTPKKTPKKPGIPVLEVERKTPRQEYTEPPVSAMSQEPVHPSHEINLAFDRQSSPKISTRGGKDINTFLQKVRDAERIKPACSRRLQSLVKVSTPPPEPEDDFLILEDDIPLIYIPCKTSRKRMQRQKETKVEHSSTGKNDSTDKGTKDSPVETAQKDEELEKENPKGGVQPVNKKMKKSKGKDKRNEVTGHGEDKDKVPIPKAFSTGHVLEKEKPNKKKPSKKVAKAPKEVKSLKDEKENAQEKNTETIDLHSLSEKEVNGSSAEIGKALVDGWVNRNTLPVVSAGSSSEDSEVLGIRKRKQPGQWWLSCSQSTEETKVTDNQPTPKKSKQNNKVSSAGLPLPIKCKKDTVFNRRNQKRPVPESHEQTNRAEEKAKRNTKIITSGETPDKRKTTDEAFNTNEVEETENQDVQQHVPDQDLEQEDFSPLVLARRGLSLNSGNKVFQRVYHHVSNENLSSTPTSVSPRRLQQPPREGKGDKRRRKSPGEWWLVNNVSEDEEHTSSQHQKLYLKETKSQKKRKNQSKQSRSQRLGSPENGNMAVSSKLLGGTSTPSLEPKLRSAPKTVKCSLATFKDIFTSATETEMCNRDTEKNNRYNVCAHSAEEAGVFLQNHDTLLDSKCQSENTFKELKSGLCSTIQLQQYEENEDLFLPSSRVHAALSISDLCAPPLKPLILQSKDKANLTEWFKSLWPSLAPNATEVTPNEFDWYFYKNRAIGFLLDANCGSACIGRILLGSYMKKPLWVDHSASTVFNLLTSSVNIVIDSRESSCHAGQCFTVQCGHAYSIRNITAQPAVLYFTRILAEGSE